MVIVAIPSFVIWIIGADIIGLDVFLIFRILRIFKFFRLVRFVPQIDRIIKGVGRALKASIIILFSFFVINFTIAIISCLLFRDSAPEYFADPLLSFYSIFKIFTIEGWYDIPDAISSNSTPIYAFFTKLYFVIVLFIGGIFGLFLVNSIFVDSMVSDNNDELEKRVIELQDKIDKLVDKLDKTE